jgi:hypothetical protein
MTYDLVMEEAVFNDLAIADVVDHLISLAIQGSDIYNNTDVVLTSLIASIATLALNSALNVRLDFFM